MHRKTAFIANQNQGEDGGDWLDYSLELNDQSDQIPFESPVEDICEVEKLRRENDELKAKLVSLENA